MSSFWPFLEFAIIFPFHSTIFDGIFIFMAANLHHARLSSVNCEWWWRSTKFLSAITFATIELMNANLNHNDVDDV
jgi:hypothetical protein